MDESRRMRAKMLQNVLLGAVCAAGLMLSACSGAENGSAAAEEAQKTTAKARAGAIPLQAGDSYFQAAAKQVETRAAGRPFGQAKNVILFVGDGMGISTITAARIHAGQLKGTDGESYRLAMETLPHAALSKTYSHDAQVSDLSLIHI